MKQHPRFSLQVITLACMAMVGCASKPPLASPELAFSRTGEFRAAGALGAAPGPEQKETQISKGPTPPAPIAGNLRPATPKTQPSETAGDLTVTIEQMTLPAFIQSIYGGILRVNYSVDAVVNARTDLITFRTPKPMSAARLGEVAGQLLKSYGVAVQDFGGVLRIVPDTSVASTLPLVLRGRAQPSVPLPLRPIFHYIESEAVKASNFLPTLKTIMGDKVKMDADSFGGLLLSGQPDDIKVALELVQVFDQPGLRGQNSTRVAPRYWGADEFSRRLGEVLRAEGYSVSNQAGSGDPITLLAMPPINSVLIFASSKEVMAHILEWVAELDQLTAVQAGSAFFTYPVRNADAQELAKSLNELISGSNSAASAPASTGGTPAPASTTSRSRRVVVNNATNSLIFQGGSQEDYRQWLSLLAELDKPVKSALIDVLVAEVALSDNSDLGFTWQLDQLGAGTSAINLTGNTYNFQSSGAGLAVSALLGGSSLRTLAISALAANSDSRVISNPRVMTRNGESASISVGQDVPIVTSQGSTSSTGLLGGTTVIPQTIQYRNTGVLLTVRPVIHAGDRIDLEISQEVSSAEPTTTGVTSSPTIRKRSVQTKLSLRDGATVMLAGLISGTNTESDSGVPGLKDIPVLGNLFKTSGRSSARTELVMLITPYIINDTNEAEAATDAYQATLGPWADSVRARVKAGRAARLLLLNKAVESQLLPSAVGSSEVVVPDTSVPHVSTVKRPSVGVPAVQKKGRMINLTDRPAGTEEVMAPAATGGMGATGSEVGESAVVPLSTGKPAPSVVNGVKMPSGATVVDDPELIRQILDANRKR